MNKCHRLQAQDKTGLLTLLRSEVSVAHALTNKFIKLLGYVQSQPCGEYQRLVDETIDGISTIIGIEKRILEEAKVDDSGYLAYTPKCSWFIDV